MCDHYPVDSGLTIIEYGHSNRLTVSYNFHVKVLAVRTLWKRTEHTKNSKSNNGLHQA